jgi:hypothetical protein
MNAKMTDVLCIGNDLEGTGRDLIMSRQSPRGKEGKLVLRPGFAGTIYRYEYIKPYRYIKSLGVRVM